MKTRSVQQTIEDAFRLNASMALWPQQDIGV